MKKFVFYNILFIIILCAYSGQAQNYSWLSVQDNSEPLCEKIGVPTGYTRQACNPQSYGYWLQHLPMKSGNPPVYLYNGALKGNQNAHFAVVNIDVGTSDLQQCADAVMRLRAEYLYSKGQYNDISFNFVDGLKCSYSKWQQGYTTTENKGKSVWVKRGQVGNSYANFKKYMRTVFAYASTLSLSKQLQSIDNVQNIAIGDVFIKGGSPGHAVVVVDVAENSKGQKVFLLAQSYMPAQDIQILKNYNNPRISPWYSAEQIPELITPEWTFKITDLKRF